LWNINSAKDSEGTVDWEILLGKKIGGMEMRNGVGVPFEERKLYFFPKRNHLI